jgi:hypothetical protein
MQAPAPPHTFGVPGEDVDDPPQVSGAVHVPQLTVLPQPSPMGPQLSVAPHGFGLGVQLGAPQTLGVPPPPHEEPAGQLPQLTVLPQPSPTEPQLTPSAAQVAPSDPPMGVHAGAPHWLGVPPPPHVWFAGHVPQLSVLPQPSPAGPQPTAVPPGPAFAHVRETHVVAVPHWFGVPPPPHEAPPVQLPQLSVPPQPSDCVPQLALSAVQVVFVHVPGVPHSLGPAAPQTCGEVQVPHMSVPPQPSPAVPQLIETPPAPALAHVLGTHIPGGLPHALAVPAPPHVSGAVQVPQLSVPPQPSACVPHVAPSSVHVFGVQVCAAPQTLGVPPPPQLSSPVHVPQLAIVPPQPSPAGPQLIAVPPGPAFAHVFGTHMPGGLPHWFAIPAPPHVSGEVQVPHIRVPPQPSACSPQFAPRSPHVLGTQALGDPQVLAVPPPPHVSGAVQVPHIRVPPQPSPAGPQVAAVPPGPALAHVIGTHGFFASGGGSGVAQTPGFPSTPHFWPFEHVPHWSRLPQPSPIGPQLTPLASHVVGMQPFDPPQTLGLPPPPHVSGALQLPQSSVPPHPSPCVPQVKPRSAHVRLVHVVPVPLLSPPRRRPASAIFSFIPPAPSAEPSVRLLMAVLVPEPHAESAATSAVTKANAAKRLRAQVRSNITLRYERTIPRGKDDAGSIPSPMG